MIAQACNPSLWEIVAQESHPQLHGEFKDSLNDTLGSKKTSGEQFGPGQLSDVPSRIVQVLHGQQQSTCSLLLPTQLG